MLNAATRSLRAVIPMARPTLQRALATSTDGQTDRQTDRQTEGVMHRVTISIPPSITKVISDIVDAVRTQKFYVGEDHVKRLRETIGVDLSKLRSVVSNHPVRYGEESLIGGLHAPAVLYKPAPDRLCILEGGNDGKSHATPMSNFFGIRASRTLFPLRYSDMELPDLFKAYLPLWMILSELMAREGKVFGTTSAIMVRYNSYPGRGLSLPPHQDDLRWHCIITALTSAHRKTQFNIYPAEGTTHNPEPGAVIQTASDLALKVLDNGPDGVFHAVSVSSARLPNGKPMSFAEHDNHPRIILSTGIHLNSMLTMKEVAEHYPWLSRLTSSDTPI